jgi:hypothetical protein
MGRDHPCREAARAFDGVDVMDWEPRVGMRVVCVDNSDDGHGIWDADEHPVLGRVYTISRVFFDVFGIVAIEFDDLRRSVWSRDYWGGDVGYHLRRFRPLDERRLDIFRSILTQAPTEKEPA